MIAALRERRAVHETLVEVEQRLGSGRGRGRRIVAARLRIQNQHG
jgi:hypothetical protein